MNSGQTDLSYVFWPLALLSLRTSVRRIPSGSEFKMGEAEHSRDDGLVKDKIFMHIL